MKICPSILSADPTKLGEEIRSIEKTGADSIHWDVMDGNFTEAITFGHHIIANHRKLTELRFDVHLMVINVERHIENFALAGADMIIIHPESTIHLHSSLSIIKSLGKKTGLALNPTTSINVIDYCFDVLDMVLVMGVNPGSSGQEFIQSQLRKISELKNLLPASMEICVDGGITDQNIRQCKECGANSFVSGSYIFKSANYSNAIQKLKES